MYDAQKEKVIEFEDNQGNEVKGKAKIMNEANK